MAWAVHHKYTSFIRRLGWFGRAGSLLSEMPQTEADNTRSACYLVGPHGSNGDCLQDSLTDVITLVTPASLGRLATAVLLRGQDTSTETGTVRIRRSKMIQLVETKGPQAQLCFPGTALLSREEARSSTSHSVAKDKGDTQRPDYPRK